MSKELTTAVEPSKGTLVGTAEPGGPTLTQQMAEVPNVERLMALAVEKGKEGVETLERLVALQNTVREQHARDSFYRSLAEFQAKCPPVFKNRTASITGRGGGSFTYKFADFETVARHIQPYLNAVGLSYTFDSTLSADGKMLEVICTVRHILGHSETSRFTAPTESSTGAISAAQKVGVAHTYAKRYTLSSALGLAWTDSDTDGAGGPGEGAGGEPCSPEQLEQIKTGIQVTDTNVANFCQAYGIESIEQLPASRFDHANRRLNAIADRQGGAR